MDRTQVGLGVALLALAGLMLVSRSVSNSRVFLYVLTVAALAVSAWALAVCALRNHRATHV